MKRTQRDTDIAHRHERWSFDDPKPPVAPEAREDRLAPQARDERPAAPNEMPQERRARPEPQPRPAKPGVSPWRKIQIPDEDRERAAAAGLYRYVGKPSSGAVKAPSSLPIAARFSAPPEPSPPPAPARKDARRAVPIADAPASRPPADESFASPPEQTQELEEAAFARAAAHHARYARRIETPRAPPPQAHSNPHLGLTVGIIVAVSVAAAIGLSWIAAPTIDAASPQRADLLQRFAPQTQMAEQPAEQARPTISNALIEVAPNMPAQPAAASAVQPIEVTP